MFGCCEFELPRPQLPLPSLKGEDQGEGFNAIASIGLKCSLPLSLVKGEATRTAQLTIKQGYRRRAEGKHLEERRVRSDMKDTI